jgi:dipeptidyl aminopeptidase/acylaminoacyl peptidase
METILSGGKPLRLLSAAPVSRPAGPAPAILLLHGAGGNVGYWFSRVAEPLTQVGCFVFAVHYFDRTGTQRAGPAELADGVHVLAWLEAVRDTVQHLAADPRIDPSRVGLIGISLGGFLSLSLAATLPRPGIRAVAEISGGLIPPWREQATTAFPPTLLLHGDRDTIVPVAQAYDLAARLARLGVEHETVILPGESHWFTPAAEARLLELATGFLARHLLRPRASS